MTLENSKKWYDNKPLLIVLLFVLPPVGVIGIIKRNSLLWKKILYSFFALISSLILLVIILAIFNPIDYYKSGVDNFNDGKYELAIKDFEKVGSNDTNYKDAVSKIGIANQKIKELSIAIEKENIKKLKAYKDFQKTWSDSIVKFWQGDYINKHLTSKNSDTIYFQLSKKATEGNWQSTAELHQSIYQKQFDSIAINKFNNKLKTVIKIIPNEEQQNQNNVIAVRQNKIKLQFSSWDGSHSALKSYVKDNMNDPSSFDHIKTTYSDKGNYLLVQMKFRGKNSFGAKIIEVVTAKVDLEGNILSVQ
ncbi:hypothetical protein V3Q90_00975 [Flavobacterium oreochromis]|uniref:hypothetical protein n=2 Tax=Flavobacterium TaxID=237 RepID=UPI00385A1E35